MRLLQSRLLKGIALAVFGSSVVIDSACAHNEIPILPKKKPIIYVYLPLCPAALEAEEDYPFQDETDCIKECVKRDFPDIWSDYEQYCNRPNYREVGCKLATLDLADVDDDCFEECCEDNEADPTLE